MSLKQKLDALAVLLIDEASSVTTELAAKEKVDIFKAASIWYLGNKKVSLKEPDEDKTVSTFGALREKINGKGSVQ